MRSPQRFEILWESRFASWTKDIGILFSRVPVSMGSVWPFRSLSKSKSYKPLIGFVVSVLVHAAVFVLYIQLNAGSGYAPPRNLEAVDNAPIYLDMEALKALHILRELPVIKPAGPGGQPGASEHAVKVILQAATVQHPKYTIVLNPLKPDNNRQAINQKLSPPDMKIQLEQNVPDILLAKGEAISRPQVDMSLHQPMAPTNNQDHTAEAAPTIASNTPELSFKITPTVAQPQLPVSYFANGTLHAAHGASSSTGQATGGSAIASGDPNGGVVVVSVDPGTFSKLASLAQGNRYGALAIAPAKEGSGSPGGSANGTAGGGSGGPGKGGDGSSGVGPGHSGGGGGGAEGPERATLSASGGAGRTGGVDSHNLIGSVRPATVFPVVSGTKLRRPPLVVSTGPIGGGGLEVYGALPCGKVYTIFLPMPGKNWVLEYCAHLGGDPKAAQSDSGVIQMEVGLIPPSADQQFDFHRLAVPEKDADKLIVLKGLIDKDGSISDVHVYQGVQPEMDAQAALAFASWKFRPATRANLPVSVDVLVGIPARIPEKLNEAPAGVQGN